ncbi:NAD(P)H-hydrate dehydratase [Methanobrevibacter sp. DSM 116169]|uniref:NAD(P)H-hydrate dehydratase n=1 Tax=Methanobrevibacter sp. DSM 116169 TaxID=3242727 RepID=UPI0038FC1FAB
MNPIDMVVTDLNCENLGISRLALMESAGKSLSDEIAKIATFNFSKPVKIAIFTGSGGNGGDGLVAARHLLNRGYEVELYMLSQDFKDSNALKNFEIIKNLKPMLSRLKINSIDDLDNDFKDYIIIDAILGTGIKGKLKNKVKNIIELINNSAGFTISVDVPSGLDPLTGDVYDIAIIPEYTVSFHKVKTGVKIAGEEKVGGIVISDIGIPIEAEYFTGSGDLLRLKNRNESSHKGNNGKVLIIGGSLDYHGAPAIAGMSALKSGADLVYIASPESASDNIKSFSPNFIVNELEGDYLNLKNLDDILKDVDKVDSVLIGPGAGLNEETGKLLNILVSKIKKPLVLDADALKLVELSLIKNKENLIITPHLFEFKSFFSKLINDDDLNLNFKEDDYEYNKEKILKFQSITRNIKGTVILKGHYDLVLNNKKLKINKTGNPGMTVGGTGDALAGLSVSLLSQDISSYDAGILAIYLNGRAGDLAESKLGDGFLATDILEYYGPLMGEIIK